MSRQTNAISLAKRVGVIAEWDFIALPEDMLVAAAAVKIMRDRDVSASWFQN